MQRMEQPYQMMQNPCTTDQVRFLCGPDAACLKAHLSELSPSCAMFLLKSTARPSPEPSPEPMAQVSGFYSQASMGEDGQMYIQEGRLSPREGKALQGEMQGMLDLVMSEFFGQPPPQPRVASPSPSTSSHPCDAEVTKCTGELNGVTSRDAIQQCLVAHYAQLSSGCKCFLHQTMGEELEKSAAAAKSSACPRSPSPRAVSPARSSSRRARRPSPSSTRTRTRATTESRLTGTLVLEESPPPFAVEYAYPRPGHHRFTCALFMMLFFLSLFLVVRRVVALCCATPKQRLQLSVEPLVAAKITTTKM